MEPINTRKVEAYERLNSEINVIVGAANTIAGRCMYDALETLVKDKGLYRQRVKYLSNEARRNFEAYEKMHIRNFGDRYQLLLDYLDSVEDEIMPHVQKMYWSVKSAIDRENEPDSGLKARVELARTMIDYACHVYDTQLENTRRDTGYDFRKYTAPAKLDNVLRPWSQLCRILCRTDRTIDLNADGNCRLAFEIIDRTFTSAEVLNMAGYKALKLNPELIKGDMLDEFRELEQMYGEE